MRCKFGREVVTRWSRGGHELVTWRLQVVTLSSSGHMSGTVPTLETTPGYFDGFLSQLPYKYYQNREASVGD